MARLSYGDYRKIRPGDAGYTPARAKNGWHYSPTAGNAISKRQFQQAAHGGTSLETASKIAKGGKESTYSRLLKSYTNKYNQDAAKLGLPPVNRNEARRHKTFTESMKVIKRDGRAPKGDIRRAPHSALALALEDLNMRPANGDFFVGDTPT